MHCFTVMFGFVEPSWIPIIVTNMNLLRLCATSRWVISLFFGILCQTGRTGTCFTIFAVGRNFLPEKDLRTDYDWCPNVRFDFKAYLATTLQIE